MELSVYQKAEFLTQRGYKVGIAKGTLNYPANVTKEGTQLNSSVNYAYNLEMRSTPVFPEPQKIDYRKFIQPMKQDFITKNGLTISNMIPNN